LLAKAHSTPAATKPENTPRTSRHRAGQRAAFDRDRYLIIRGALPDETAAAFVKHSGAGPITSPASPPPAAQYACISLCQHWT
jgi:hypothetical protein